jgi:hypothetical protein
MCRNFRGTCCLHRGVSVGIKVWIWGRVDQCRVQAELTGSGVEGGGVSWTSKRTKKQNGTIENTVCDWSELENRLRHGVPVGKSKYYHKSGKLICMYVFKNENKNVDQKDGKQED